MPPSATRPLGRALVVFLENGGTFGGVQLPPRARRLLDYGSEEYAKRALSWHGIRQAYDRVWILEDRRARAEELQSALLGASQRHVVDVLILAHGQPEGIVGWQGELVGRSFFAEMRAWRHAQPSALRLRAVYTIACHSGRRVWDWLALGAHIANGIGHENWLPEPTLSLFLRQWAQGRAFGAAARYAHLTALHWMRRLSGNHPYCLSRLQTSRQFIAGRWDTTLGNVPRADRTD